MSSNDTSMSLLTQLKIQIPCLAQEGQKGMVIYYINIAKHRVKKFPQEENNAITKIKMGRGRMAENSKVHCKLLTRYLSFNWKESYCVALLNN